MGTPADTLVAQHPDRSSQLLGPVYDYLKPMMPYSAVPQNLYMAVFFPVARNWPPNTKFADKIAENPKLGGPKGAALFTSQNPGIVYVSDYVNKVEAAAKRSRPVLSANEEKTLTDLAAKLGTPRDSLLQTDKFRIRVGPAGHQSVLRSAGACSIHAANREKHGLYRNGRRLFAFAYRRRYRIFHTATQGNTVGGLHGIIRTAKRASRREYL